jgi:N-acetylglucosaminyldiphosphoundecaprenol N-acetyl-beta-D-mannosaminyltransferase
MAKVLALVKDSFLTDDKTHYICTTNPEFIIDAQTNSYFREIINKSDLSLPDGSGIVMAKRYLNEVEKYPKNFLFPLKALFCGLRSGLSSWGAMLELIPGVELFSKLCTLSAKEGYTVAFLGGRPRNSSGKRVASDIDIARKTADILKRTLPALRVIYASSAQSADETDDLPTLDELHRAMKEQHVSSIDFLFVAYNHVRQEAWIVRNASKIPAKVSIGVGGTFDYVSGFQKLPSTAYISTHTGWLYRLLQEPWRFKRIFHAFPLFPVLVYINSCRKS